VLLLLLLLQEDERIARKFFVALVLHEIINEVPMETVVAKYGVDRHKISRLQVSRGRQIQGRESGRNWLVIPNNV